MLYVPNSLLGVWARTAPPPGCGVNGTCLQQPIACAAALGGVVQQDERPVTIQDTWRLIHRGLGHTTRISQSILTVEDVATTDVGYYICTARNLQGETTVATTVEFS